MSKPAVSVIICTWNRATALETTLRSLLEQQGLDDDQVEVIVVDNNSTDGTRAVVEHLCTTWPLGKLHYLFEPRQGKQFALNRGIAAAGHPVLAFTDDDILFRSDWLNQVQVVFSDPDVDLVGGRTCLLWPDAGPPDWFSPEMMAVVGGVDLGAERLDPAPEGYAPAGANLVARRSLFQRVGMFSETHFRHMDYEFGMRCYRERARIVYAPSLVVEAPVDAAILNKGYFRRWAFKAGIAGDHQGGTPAVPAWVYRRLLEDGAYLLTVGRFGSAAASFPREFRFQRMLGTVANAWHARWHPAKHAQWVQRYSQKKNDAF